MRLQPSRALESDSVCRNYALTADTSAIEGEADQGLRSPRPPLLTHSRPAPHAAFAAFANLW